MSKAFYVDIPNRGLIHVEGDDRIEFLQGLITNDVTKLPEQRIQYACLLTPQGKFLHDFFLHWGEGVILIDCEGAARAQDLYKRLNQHRLRAKVILSVEDTHPVYAIFDPSIGLADPRHFKMGNRVFEKPDLPAEPFKEWDLNRLVLGVPDGSRDIIVEKSTLLEVNLDQFNGVDFDKGCYMGQELTARMHYRNLGKKHLRAIEFIDGYPPAPFSELTFNDRVIGDVRSSCDKYALAMIRDEYIEDLKNAAQHQYRLLG